MRLFGLMAALAAVFLFGGGILCAGCGRTSAEEENGRPVVGVSSPAVGRIVSELVGDEAEVVVLLPAGADPENYEPDMASMKRLAKADIFLSLNTPGFEEKLGRHLAATMPELHLVDLSVGIDRLEGDGDHHGEDPHLLSSPSNALKVIDNAMGALTEIYPEMKTGIDARGKAFGGKVEKERNSAREILKDKKGATFVVTHPSLGYFAHEFGLLQLALEQDGKEVTPRQLEERLQKAREAKATVVFYEQSHSPRQAQQAAAELGIEAKPIDFNAADFVEQYRRIAEDLRVKDP